MPFYEIEGMKESPSKTNPRVTARSVVGEFMKVGVVTKPEGEGPPLHMHPNEEQFTLILDGRLHYILGEEDKIVERGDLIHIPRRTNHRSRAVGGEATFFTVKFPAGTGELDEDYNVAEGAGEAEKKYPGGGL